MNEAFQIHIPINDISPQIECICSLTNRYAIELLFSFRLPKSCMSRRIAQEKPLICTTMLANGSRLIGYFMFIHKLYQDGILNAMTLNTLHHKNVHIFSSP